MAIILSDQHTLAYDAEFINRIRQAMVTEALVIMTEDSDAAHNGTDEYVAKMALASSVIHDANDTARQAALLIATKSSHTDPSEIGDAGYTDFVKEIWLPMSSYNPHYVQAE